MLHESTKSAAYKLETVRELRVSKSSEASCMVMLSEFSFETLDGRQKPPDQYTVGPLMNIDYPHHSASKHTIVTDVMIMQAS